MQNELSSLVAVACKINALNSGLYPGHFKDQGTFEAILAKYYYYSSSLEFIVEMFISLQKCHVFHDGNKRTSLGLTQVLLEANNYYIVNELELVDAQILFIEGKINIDYFREIIYISIEKDD